ncbi:TolB family protein [Lentzea sp. NPDC092896]|uniref:TolB family protein n=1 Tax=Lentzea sp. NPDC092896 TaxID=3364127 RepID=UPI00382645F6
MTSPEQEGRAENSAPGKADQQPTITIGGTKLPADLPSGRELLPGQRADLRVLDVATGESELVLSSTERLIEAPQFHPDGRHLVVNGDGVLLRVDLQGDRTPTVVPVTGLPPVNNDHVVTPDGLWHIASAVDGHLHRVPWNGGEAVRVTVDKEPERCFRHFLHGISPDGRRLTYVGVEMADGDEWGRRAVWTLDLGTGAEVQVGDGYSPADGPEFSPDGKALYFNSEFRSTIEGHAQLFRRDEVSGTVEQLTGDERVNWFPHPSPDGAHVAYLSYPAGTVGHPADLPVELRLLTLPRSAPRTLVALRGGQGTINVNSWSPDSRRIAYVEYPISARKVP